jgi:DNA-binding GntR family transcriptional regulator
VKTRAPRRASATVAVYRTKEEYVADYVREGILSGDIARGERLKQAELAAELGLSITPVREALKLLVAEGYILGANHRGALVAPFDLSTADEIVDLRALLEARLTIRAMRKMTLGEMQQLQLLAQEHEDKALAGEFREALAANYRFHRYLFSLAREPVNLRFVQVLWTKYPFDFLGRVPGRCARAVGEHARIMDAVVSRNEDAAAIATRSHVRAGWEELKVAIATDPALARDIDNGPAG